MSRWQKTEVSDHTEYMRDWVKTPEGLDYKKRHSIYMKEWRSKNKDRYKVNQRQCYANIRLECFDAYGGPICKCCGETMLEFLHLDHINADGSKQKREIKEKTGQTLNGGTALYYYLKKNGWPDLGLQVLCANCNLGKRTGQYCPHELKKGIDMNGNPIEVAA